MQQPIVSIRMDEALKKRFEIICGELGLSVSAAVTIFAKQVCREGRIPFEITLGKDYKEKNYMKQSITYNVSIWSAEEFFAPLTQEFPTLHDALTFIENETDKLLVEHGTYIYFAIKIQNLDSHNHVIFFDDDSRYERDGEIIDNIDLDEDLLQDDKYLYNFLNGYISALINC